MTKDRKQLIAECDDGSVVGWDLKSGAKSQALSEKIANIADPDYIKRNPDPNHRAFYGYSEIRDEWVRVALSNIHPLTEPDKKRAPFGIRLDRIPINPIYQAFRIAVNDPIAGKAQLIASIEPMVPINTKTAERLITRQLVQPPGRLAQEHISKANALARQGKRPEAIKEYKKAMAADPVGLKDFDPEAEAGIWEKVGLYDAAIAKAEATAAQGQVETAVELYKKAKAIFPAFWGNKDPLQEAKRIAERRAPVSEPSSPASPQ